MDDLDASALAEIAGLAYVEPGVDGIDRRVRGRGFSYVRADGRLVGGSTRERIEALAIPPAWREVWIAPSFDSHVLAVGTDDAGRRQYVYHPDFRRIADEHKFRRVRELGAQLPAVRRYVEGAIKSDDERRRLTAAVVRVIDRLLLRVGTERYAEEHDTFGACTLRWEHIQLRRDRALLSFHTKGGAERRDELQDRDLLEVLRRLKGRAGSGSSPVFAATDGWQPDGDVVASALSAAVGRAVTAKDLRTWGATATMVDQLMRPDHASGSESDDVVIAAFDAVAQRLGNSRAVARESYVAPRVVQAHVDGELAAVWARSRRSRWYSRAERAALKVLPDAAAGGALGACRDGRGGATSP